MVNNGLDYKVDGDNEDKKECPRPGEEVDSQEDAGNEAINKRFGSYCPVSAVEMTEGPLPLSGGFDSQNQEQNGYSREQRIGDIVVSEAEY
ncbi:hypothetical protein ES703_72356 [subsurface metagenome]